MEEIDIIELLKRVKEGKAPKEIEIGNSVYEFRNKNYNINELYGNGTFLWFIRGVTLDTKIKILDKPIIEPLDDLDLTNARPETNARKINEIIDFINNKESK